MNHPRLTIGGLDLGPALGLFVLGVLLAAGLRELVSWTAHGIALFLAHPRP